MTIISQYLFLESLILIKLLNYRYNIPVQDYGVVLLTIPHNELAVIGVRQIDKPVMSQNTGHSRHVDLVC